MLIALPASGGTAGEYQTAVCDGQADFLGLYMAAELFCDGSVHHVGKHCRLQTGGVGIN